MHYKQTTKETMKTITLQRAEKIARNINAMDLNYQYTDDSRKWNFWNDLKDTLFSKLEQLTKEDLEVIKPLLKENKAKYFNLI